MASPYDALLDAPKSNSEYDALLDSSPAGENTNSTESVQVVPFDPSTQPTISATPTFLGELGKTVTDPTVKGTYEHAKEAGHIAYETLRRPLSGLLGPTESQRIEESIPFGKDAQGNVKYEYKPLGDRPTREAGLMTSFLPIDPLAHAEGDSKTKSAMKAGFNVAEGLVGSLLSPLGIALGGVGGELPQAGKAIGGLFSADMLASVPAQIEKTFTGKTLQEKIEGGLGAVMSLAMGYGGAKVALGGREQTPTEIREYTSKELAKLTPDETPLSKEPAVIDPQILDGLVLSREKLKERQSEVDPDAQARLQESVDDIDSQLLRADRRQVQASEERVRSRPQPKPQESQESTAVESAPPRAENTVFQRLKQQQEEQQRIPQSPEGSSLNEEPLPISTSEIRRIAGQDAAEPNPSTGSDYLPAIKVNGEEIVGNKGDTHKNILDRHLDKNPDDADALLNFDTKENPNYFKKGNEDVSRAQLKEAVGVSDSQGLAALESAAPESKTVEQRQSVIPPELRTDPEVQKILSEEKTRGMARQSFTEGGALGGKGGGKKIVTPTGVTPQADVDFIRIESAPKRFGKGLMTEGAADVLARQKNKVGRVLSKAIKKHVDVEQEIHGQLISELDRNTKGMSRRSLKDAVEELEPYLAAKENGRALPALSSGAKSLLTAWENIAEKTGLLSEAHDVQVFDPNTGGYRKMHRIGSGYVPRMLKPEVQKAISDPRSNPSMFNTLSAELAANKGITITEAAAELRGISKRFSSTDFMGNIEMVRVGKLPEEFYDYNIGNLISRYVPAFSERMAQIIAFGQRLGTREAPLRENLWDVAMKETEDKYTQNWLRSAEDQATNLRPTGGMQKAAQQAQTAASGLLLSSPTTVARNLTSGIAATNELMGIRRSAAPLIKAVTDAQTKLDAREMGAIREDLGNFLHADQLADTKFDQAIRGTTNTMMKYSGYTGSEQFVRTHAAATASQFARDGVKEITKNPNSSRAKEALSMFKRMDVNSEKIVAENGEWKDGPETRRFIRTVIKDTQGGYRYDQVPLWANSAAGRFFYQFGRYGVQRARNIFKNAVQPAIGEEVEWHGKTMTHRDFKPLLKIGASAVILGEAFAGISSGLFGRDRKDSSIKEIYEAMSEDEKLAAAMAGERIVNDLIMAGSLGIISQPLDFAKSLKDQSRFKNPAEPPGLAGTKAVVNLAQNAIDQGGQVTAKDMRNFFGQIVPGVKQTVDIARNVFDEPLYEAENDIKTLRASAARWANQNKIDVPKRAVGEIRKSANAPVYEPIYEALLVGDADKAKFLSEKFTSEQKSKSTAIKNLRSSVRGRQPFRVGPFTNGDYKTRFMDWASVHLPKSDYNQVKRVQDRYEAAAKKAGLW